MNIYDIAELPSKICCWIRSGLQVDSIEKSLPVATLILRDRIKIPGREFYIPYINNTVKLIVYFLIYQNFLLILSKR